MNFVVEVVNKHPEIFILQEDGSLLVKEEYEGAAKEILKEFFKNEVTQYLN